MLTGSVSAAHVREPAADAQRHGRAARAAVGQDEPPGQRGDTSANRYAH